MQRTSGARPSYGLATLFLLTAVVSSLITCSVTQRSGGCAESQTVVTRTDKGSINHTVCLVFR